MSNQSIDIQLKAVWGAAEPPFAETTPGLFETPELLGLIEQLEQLLRMRASGVLAGANGTGKSLMLDALIDRLPDKEFMTVKLSHSSVTGSDLLRSLARAYGLEPAMRRSDNVHGLLKFWNGLGGLHPVIVLDEAQELESRALEEVRLLFADRAKLTGKQRTAAFSLVLCGDQDLLPTLRMGVHKALRSRLGFCLGTTPFTEEQTSQYVMFRWAQVGVQSCPFDAQALTLLHQAADGIARTINHLGALATAAAARVKDHTVNANHVQEALEQLPWLAAAPIHTG
jgi:type II secretory pathway predicted ATPase ExeA